MALSDHKKRFRSVPYGVGVDQVNVAASTTIYDGAIVVKDGSGDAIPAPVTGASFFIGIASGGYDNSGSLSATTDEPLTVEVGQFEQMTFDVAPTAADKGAPVYYADDDTVSLTIVPATGVAQSQVGILVRPVSGNDGIVNTSKAVSA